MEIVTCDHCGVEIDKKDAVPCVWKEYDLTWYYCGRCEADVFDGEVKTKINNEEAVKILNKINVDKCLSIN